MQKLYSETTNAGLTAFTRSEVRLIKQAASRIGAIYDAAQPETRSMGASWYTGKAAALAQSVAEETGISFETAAAVIAVCSPRTRWSVQVGRTAAFVSHILGGGWPQSAPSCSAFLGSMEKAASIILWGDENALRGPKVETFYRNIIGDESVVTLDVWAIRAVAGELSEEVLSCFTRGRPRLILEAAYHMAAYVRSESPAAMQAVVWVEVRGTAD